MINMIKPLLATTFLFSFLFIFLSTPAFALLPISINQSITINNGRAQIDCINISAAVTCYVATSKVGSAYTLYSWNETLQDQKSCTLSGTSTTSSLYGFTLLNSTHGRIYQGTGTWADFDITTIATGTCANLTGFTTYAINQFTNGMSVYNNATIYSAANGILNFTHGTVTTNWFESNNYGTTIPNKSTNATIYGIEYRATDVHGYYNKYTNGAFAANISRPSLLWGVSDSQGRSALVKISAATTWLYYLEDYQRIYRMNFTAAENVGLGTNITATSPINNQSISAVMTESVQLTVALTTYNNGTISFYNDGIWIGNTSITANYSSTSYFSTPVLADGQHYWNATFYDIYGNSWNTGNQTYFKEATSAITTVGQSLANALGVTLDYGKMMLALLISAALSGALAYYVKWQLFLPSMFVCSFFFAVAGFFPAWFTLVFIVIGGVLFAKFSGLV